ncbi:transposase [Streptococcus suis]|nr:transposase [Streptococcus suis]MCK4032359.1 transposase [Streptococcus suis]
MLDQIKAHLLDSINDIVSTANQFLLHPKKDFSRKSQLTRNLDERAAFIDMLKTSSFKQALVIMDRGYESYNVMAHCQERNWSYIIRIRDGNNSMKTSFRLPDTPCFYHLSSSSRYLTKNILCLVIQIRKLFYFGLKFSVKSAYKTNTLC